MYVDVCVYIYSRWVIGVHTAAALWDAASRACSIQLASFLCNCHLASQKAAAVWTPTTYLKNHPN